MQEWEYLEVYVGDTGWQDSLGRSGKITQVSGDNPSSSSRSAKVLNDRGSAGWELAGVAAAHPRWYTLFLKRPKS